MSNAVKKWSPEEDKILLQQIELLSSQGKSKNWTAIASAVPGRSNKDCRKRWCNHLVGGLRKGPWDPSEDRRLAIGVKEYGVQWPLVAEEVRTRSADQCAKRWHHSLDPSLDRSKWSVEEKKRLFKAVEKHGRAWKQIQTEYFPGRATNDVKNKYVILTRKRDTQNSDNEPHNMISSVGNGTGRANSESMTLISPRQDTMTQDTPAEDVPTLGHDDATIVSNDYDAEQFGDSFPFDLYSHTIPTAMDLDPNTANPLAMDIPFDISSADLMTGLAEPSTTANINDGLFPSKASRRCSTGMRTEVSTGPHFDSETDSQSMLMNMGILQNQPAKLVLTIENPSPDAITGIMGVLVSDQTKFRMEMQ